MKKVYLWGVIWSFLFLQISSAAVLNVPSGYSTIQLAINAASNGDTIVVAAGTYNEKNNFNGKAITVRSSDPNNSSVVSSTIINAGGSTVTFENSEGNSSVLCGFTITGGTGTISGSYGGGIYCSGASPIIKKRYRLKYSGHRRRNVLLSIQCNYLKQYFHTELC